MIHCPSCQSENRSGTTICAFCGKELHATANFILTNNAKKTPKPVTPFQRIVASTTDILFTSAPLLISWLTLYLSKMEYTINDVLLRSWFFLVLVLALQLYYLVHDGQSVGKKIMKIAIVDYRSNGHPSPFQLIVLRTLLPLIPLIIPIVGLALYSVNISWSLNKHKRCIHDIIAGTSVVHE